MRPASSFREARRRRRHQFYKKVFWFLCIAAAIGSAAIVGFEVGTAKSRHEVRLLEEELVSLNDKQYAMEIRTAEALKQAEITRDNWRDLQDRYRQDVPVGDLKELMAQLKGKLEAAVPVDRVRFVLDQLGKDRECEAGTETKRFMLRTPVTAGPVENAAFVDGTILLSGEGSSARNGEGLAEAWFDPSLDIEVRFLQIDGEISLARGRLPITHSIVVGDKEHIFIVRRDENRGFVSATAQSCAYP